MAKDPSIHLTIHVSDETVIEAQRVESSSRDFVAVKIGFPAGVLLFNPEQAKALAKAATEAYSILKLIEVEEDRAEMDRAWDEVDSDDTLCTISNPCSMCRDAEERYSGYGYDEPEYEPF